MEEMELTISSGTLNTNLALINVDIECTVHSSIGSLWVL
jgi:hypothetical protein